MRDQIKAALLMSVMALVFQTNIHAMEVLKYEPSVVTLRGTLSIQDFAGPPNYKDVTQGDRLERIWVLALSNPIKIVAPANDELLYAQEGVKEIQLVCSKQCDKQFALSAGKNASLVGTLFPAHTGHHHKGVLMYVQKRN